MPIAEVYTGTSSIGTTEWSMTANNTGPVTTVGTDGVYQAFIDVNALATGDAFEIRVYERARSGDTQRVCFKYTLSNAQGEPLFATPSLILIHAWDFTLKKLAGTDRTITWSIRQVA